MSSITEDGNLPIAIAEAIPILPPRPDAYATLLTTDDFLPGAQTLLYSIQVCYPQLYIQSRG